MVDGGASSALQSEEDLQERYESVFRSVARFFAARGVPRDEAADLAQESITRTLLHLRRRGTTADDLWPLIRTISRNLYVERGRRLRPRLVPLEDAFAVADDRPTPDELAVVGERRTAVQRAVAALQPRQRRVIEMSMKGASPADIARELGIKRNAADALIHRARRRLATQLRSEGSAVSGFIGLTSWRIRAALRRAAASVGRLDPGGHVAVGATGLAAVAFAAVVAVGVGSSAGTRDASTPSSATHTLAAQTTAQAPAAGRTSVTTTRLAGNDSSPSAIVVDLRDHRVGARAEAQNPTNPDDNEFLGVDVWHRRDPGDRGKVGPMLDRVTVHACTDQASACGGNE